jgi:hypothetical protein
MNFKKKYQHLYAQVRLYTFIHALKNLKCTPYLKSENDLRNVHIKLKKIFKVLF